MLRCSYVLLRDKEEVELPFQLPSCPRLISHPVMNMAHVAVTHFPSEINSKKFWSNPIAKERAQETPLSVAQVLPCQQAGEGKRCLPAPAASWGPAKAELLARACQLPLEKHNKQALIPTSSLYVCEMPSVLVGVQRGSWLVLQTLTPAQVLKHMCHYMLVSSIHAMAPVRRLSGFNISN